MQFSCQTLNPLKSKTFRGNCEFYSRTGIDVEMKVCFAKIPDPVYFVSRIIDVPQGILMFSRSGSDNALLAPEMTGIQIIARKFSELVWIPLE